LIAKGALAGMSAPASTLLLDLVLCLVANNLQCCKKIGVGMQYLLLLLNFACTT
jgi:hypothetical protein